MGQKERSGQEQVKDEHETCDEGKGSGQNAPISRIQLIALIAGPAFALAIYFVPAPGDMKSEAWRLVALASWMVIWWLGEAVPIPVTALLPIPLMPLFDIDKMMPVAANFAHPIIFLFLGGFMLAAAMQRWGLHKRIALYIVTAVGTGPGQIIAGFMLATALLSMWISNTATTIMMFAVGLSIIECIAQKTPNCPILRNFGVALMLGIAYSASIGGVGTLIGTPPNALLASYLQSNHGVQIDFFTWMQFGVPVILIMLPIAWILLTKGIFPTRDLRIGDVGDVIKQELAGLGAMSRGERAVAIVFACAALGWILCRPLSGWTGLPINDSIIALVAATVLFAWPISRENGCFALDWETAHHIPWGILLMFGGGLALATGFDSTGLAEWIGGRVSGLAVSTWALVFLTTVAIVYLTEITSNSATTATFLPILGAVAVGLAIDPRILTIPVAMGASMAFMMPIATAPNAIVFSYEEMKLADMVKAGFWLNLVAIAVSFAAMYFLAGLVFEI